MDGIFGGDQPDLPPPIVPPSPEDPSIEEAKARQMIADRKAKGRAATDKTGGLGVSDPAPVARKVLLGE